MFDALSNILFSDMFHASPVHFSEFLPQVIPLMEVLPCNPVINLGNPLQPIGITSLSEGQSATPG